MAQNPLDFEAAKRFEKAWAPRLGGSETEGVRFVMGIIIGRLIFGHGVDREDLLAYLTAVIREDDGDGGVPPTLKAV